MMVEKTKTTNTNNMFKMEIHECDIPDGLSSICSTTYHMSYTYHVNSTMWTWQMQSNKSYLIWHLDNKEINIRWLPIRSSICWPVLPWADLLRSDERITSVRDAPTARREKEYRETWVGSQAGRPGNVIQGGCLNMTSLGDIQSAAKPSSGTFPGMVAERL